MSIFQAVLEVYNPQYTQYGCRVRLELGDRLLDAVRLYWEGLDADILHGGITYVLLLFVGVPTM